MNNTNAAPQRSGHGFDYDKPYLPLSQHYRRIFKQKVFKVSVSVAQTCPNRENQQVCIFCDEWGSAAYHTIAQQSLSEQIRINREAIRTRYRAEKFLIYFQSYTNTFGKIREMETLFHAAMQETDVVGLVIGTRPDCLPSRIVKLFETISKTHFISVELGIQTLDNEQLAFLSRGHDRECSISAINKLRDAGLQDICAHLMFGLPGETDQQLVQTAHQLSAMGITGVKLHNLHVLKNTPLETLFNKGLFTPVDLEEYARKVSLFLEHLSPEIAVHRLAAVASRWDELVAPDWTREKMRPTQFIEDTMRQNQSWQGKHYVRIQC
ncbi:MAG: TIGR01212 family radical SAM protein [SAR324 cluster bacterium]|nr:TIGR01212 family radical SAM protein [SAR324 cluster bacterium]